MTEMTEVILCVSFNRQNVKIFREPVEKKNPHLGGVLIGSFSTL